MFRVIILSLGLSACQLDYSINKSINNEYGVHCAGLPAEVQRKALNTMRDIMPSYRAGSICDDEGFILKMGDTNE